MLFGIVILTWATLCLKSYFSMKLYYRDNGKSRISKQDINPGQLTTLGTRSSSKPDEWEPDFAFLQHKKTGKLRSSQISKEGLGLKLGEKQIIVTLLRRIRFKLFFKSKFCLKVADCLSEEEKIATLCQRSSSTPSNLVSDVKLQQTTITWAYVSLQWLKTKGCNAKVSCWSNFRLDRAAALQIHS